MNLSGVSQGSEGHGSGDSTGGGGQLGVRAPAALRESVRAAAELSWLTVHDRAETTGNLSRYMSNASTSASTSVVGGTGGAKV
jgi:hypothetical protein